MSLPKLEIEKESIMNSRDSYTIKSVKAREKYIRKKLTEICLVCYSADSEVMKIASNLSKEMQQNEEK
jgi:hypothetical protein